MQNRKFWFLAASLLLVVGCANNKSPKNNKPAKPVLSVSDDETGLTWEAVEGADGYNVTVNGQTIMIQEPGYEFATEAGQYSVSVTSVKGQKESDPAQFSYTTAAASVGDLAVANGAITWSTFSGKGLEYKGGSVSEFTAVTGTSVTVDGAGLYEFRATKGFKAEGNIFYPENSLAKSIYANDDADTDFVIESGADSSDADLSEKYTKQFNGAGDGRTWTDSQNATITLNNTISDGFTDGNCVALKFTYQGKFFKFEKEIDINSTYHGFSFAVKADADLTFSISFVVTEHVLINVPLAGEIDLIGARLVYTEAAAPTNWTRYNLDFSEDGWTVFADQIGSIPFSQALALIQGAGFAIQSVSDLLALCGSFQFRTKGYNPDAHSYGTCRMYFDDVKLLQEAPTSSKETIVPPLVLNDTYSFDTDAIHGELFLANTQKYIRYNANGSAATMMVTVSEPANGEVVFTCATQGYDFVATFESLDGGKTLTLKGTPTGTGAPYLTNAVAHAIVMLDDFESYQSAGTAYYQDNQNAANTSGLRRNYFCDWNTTSSSYASSILQASWGKLAGGDGSQVFLKEGAANAYTGNKCMKLKINDGYWMRYTTTRVMPAFNTNPEAYPKATAISFMIKGVVADQPAKLRIFHQNQIKDTNVDSGATIPSNFTITPESNGWVRFTFALDGSKTYYGWSLALQNVKANAQASSPYISIDDVALVL